MKRILQALFFTLFISLAAFAQRPAFIAPKQDSYIPGLVRVKVKPGFKQEFLQNPGGRSSATASFVSPLVKPELGRKGLARRGVQAPKIDMSLYYELSFDPSAKMDSYISELTKTGYFDIVEPVYAAHVSYVPSDPDTAKQYYLDRVRALQAWNISKGSEDLTIAIVDTGGQLDHPDLIGNLYVNPDEIPANGIDDDNDGYIDNYRGWDFVGADTLNALNPNFTGDNDPSVFSGGLNGHGTMVAGCASASTDNGIGIAGIGYKTKLMFVKLSADDERVNAGVIYSGFKGILYAANQGIKIINCSWGTFYGSKIEQDIINHVTLDLGCLIVAAGGNTSNGITFPAAYDNVLSVGATDANDVHASFSSIGQTLGLSAPGVDIYTTNYGSGYEVVSGTSFSSPIVAGAAALVWAKYPSYTPQQISSLLIGSSDNKALYTANPIYVNPQVIPGYSYLLGRGRLDIASALTQQMPFLKVTNYKFADPSGTDHVVAGQQGLLTVDVTNTLSPTTSSFTMTASVDPSEKYITIHNPVLQPGVIGSGQAYSNSATPFQISVAPATPANYAFALFITFKDGNYKDVIQLYNMTANTTYQLINTNLIQTSIGSTGRLSFDDPFNSAGGIGFFFNQSAPYAYIGILAAEIGVMMGTGSEDFYDNIRTTDSKQDADFVSLAGARKYQPGDHSDAEVNGRFSNSVSPPVQRYVIDYQTMVWKKAPDDKFVIVEYTVTNPRNIPVDNFYFGMFADWDISPEHDFADWDATHKMGYTSAAANSSHYPIAGTQLLTGPANFYALNNNSAPFNQYPITDQFKFSTIVSSNLSAGVTPGGTDVSEVVSTGPYHIAPHGSITIAYALQAANNLSDLKASAVSADSLYNGVLRKTAPHADTMTICSNTPAQITPLGASVIQWYTTAHGGTSFFTGPTLTTAPLKSDTVLYVTNAANTYESLRSPVVVLVRGNAAITVSPKKLCAGDTVTLSVAKADSYLWNTGEKTQSIKITKSAAWSVKVTNGSVGCIADSSLVVTKFLPSPIAKFSVGDFGVNRSIQFTDESANAVTWSWSFGDSDSSTVRNPVHTYFAIKEYSVDLTVTSDDGCKNKSTQVISIVTGLETTASISIYPNPVFRESLKVVVQGDAGAPAKIIITNLLGNVIFERSLELKDQTVQTEVPVAGLAEGIYVVQFNSGNQRLTRKVIKMQ